MAATWIITPAQHSLPSSETIHRLDHSAGVDASAVHVAKSIKLAPVALAYGGVAVWVGGVRADNSVPYTRMVTQ